MISTSGKAERGRESCQQQQIPHDKAVRNDNGFGREGCVGRSLRLRATVWPSGRGKTPLSERILRQPETEDKKLRKDPFGGPCFEGTLRKL